MISTAGAAYGCCSWLPAAMPAFNALLTPASAQGTRHGNI